MILQTVPFQCSMRGEGFGVSIVRPTAQTSEGLRAATLHSSLPAEGTLGLGTSCQQFASSGDVEAVMEGGAADAEPRVRKSTTRSASRAKDEVKKGRLFC